MRKFLILLVAAVLGYATFELLRRFLGHEMAEPSPLGQMGPVQGAAMTAGGQGAVQRSLEPDGGSVTHRVGRGVVKRGQKA